MKKKSRQRLSDGELRDVIKVMVERLGRAMGDAMQLAEDPKQRAVIGSNTAAAVVRIAVDVCFDSYREETGERVSRTVCCGCASSSR